MHDVHFLRHDRRNYGSLHGWLLSLWKKLWSMCSQSRQSLVEMPRKGPGTILGGVPSFGLREEQRWIRWKLKSMSDFRLPPMWKESEASLDTEGSIGDSLPISPKSPDPWRTYLPRRFLSSSTMSATKPLTPSKGTHLSSNHTTPRWEASVRDHCDASDYAVGAVLGQTKDKKLHAIA